MMILVSHLSLDQKAVETTEVGLHLEHILQRTAFGQDSLAAAAGSRFCERLRLENQVERARGRPEVSCWFCTYTHRWVPTCACTHITPPHPMKTVIRTVHRNPPGPPPWPAPAEDSTARGEKTDEARGSSQGSTSHPKNLGGPRQYNKKDGVWTWAKCNTIHPHERCQPHPLFYKTT